MSGAASKKENSKEWKSYLLNQVALHPSMEPQDVYKLVYQAAFGAEHLLKDKAAARTWFFKEYEASKHCGSAESGKTVTCGKDAESGEECLYEQIQEGIFRVNLRAWRKNGLPAEWLFGMFASSVTKQRERADLFQEYLEAAKSAVEEGVFNFSAEEFTKYAEDYNKEEIHPVHHSDGYRQAENPSYRLVNAKWMRLLPLLELIATRNCQKGEEKSPFVLAIEGRSASGKTTLADELAEITGAGVVHMDDFFLPAELRTEQRFMEPGGNVHYERFCQEVLPCLKEVRGFSYQCFDCGSMRLSGKNEMTESSFWIVEGAYSRHPAFGSYADYTIFVDIDSQEQLARILRRNGEEMRAMFRQRWIPMEEKYFSECQIQKKADAIVRTDLHNLSSLAIIEQTI